MYNTQETFRRFVFAYKIKCILLDVFVIILVKISAVFSNLFICTMISIWPDLSLLCVSMLNQWENCVIKAGQGSAQCTLRKPCVGRDWQRHYSILGTLPFRDYSDVTLIPLHGRMLKNYGATNNSTSRVHILQVLRYPLSLLQLTQQQQFFFCCT